MQKWKSRYWNDDIMIWRCWRKLSLLVFFPSILYGLVIILWLIDESQELGLTFSVYNTTTVVLQKWPTLFVTAKLLILHLLSIHHYLYTWLNTFMYLLIYMFTCWALWYSYRKLIPQLHIYMCVYIYLFRRIYIHIYRCFWYYLDNHLFKKSFTA